MRDKDSTYTERDAARYRDRQDRELARKIIASGDPNLIKLLPPEFAPLPRAPLEDVGAYAACSYLMTVGTRKRKPRGGGSWTTGKKGKRIPCPNRATRFIDGHPYCDHHAPSLANPFYETEEWHELRRQTLARDRRACRYCGARATQADHVIARSKGGVDDLSNLVASCVVCNRIGGGTHFESFEAKRSYILSQRKRVKEAA